MTMFYQVLFWVTIVAIIYLIVAVGIALRAMWKRKDIEYRAKYEEHLRRKLRVAERLEQARRMQKG